MTSKLLGFKSQKSTHFIMKKALRFISCLSVLTCLLASCTRPDDNCECGIVEEMTYDQNDYLLILKNRCSGRVRTFVVDQQAWGNAVLGEEYCDYDNDPW